MRTNDAVKIRNSIPLEEMQNHIEHIIAPVFQEIDKKEELHQRRMLRAFQKNGVSELHLHSSTGYGYDDIGRETLQRIYAELFGAEQAIVSPHITSGTHAIAACLYGLLRPGDECIYITGRPYDTLQKVIGTGQDGSGSLRDYGIVYQETALTPDHQIDWSAFETQTNSRTRVVCIQRSRGYASRPSFSIEQIKLIVQKIRSICPHAIIFTDNCYGEFTEAAEPTHVGVDLLAGSLIKNPGGGLAKSGGYIVGKKKYVEKAAARLVAPGIGVEGGATYGYLRDYYQGLFLAPHVVSNALKGVVFAAALLEELGFKTSPTWQEKRTDIIQQIHLDSAERLIAFCQGIQISSPVDAHLLPEPASMPGYTDPVVMAAGTFVQGASIELSADGPLRPPYTVFLQGGLTYFHVKIAIMEAVKQMLQD